MTASWALPPMPPFLIASVAVFRGVTGVRDRWMPILQAQSEGPLDLESLTHPERVYLQSARAQHEVPWLTAILDWGKIAPRNSSEKRIQLSFLG